jgi:hypothetical protein
MLAVDSEHEPYYQSVVTKRVVISLSRAKMPPALDRGTDRGVIMVTPKIPNESWRFYP